MVELVFWLCLFYIGYTEFGYLALLWLLSKRRVQSLPVSDACPQVTVLIAAHNEERVIRTKIENTLVLDYPRDRLQIIVASDCCTDCTDEIVAEFAVQGVTLVRNCQHEGKVAALRLAESLITGDLVLFTDADSMLYPGAVRALVRRFADPQVGAVSGREARPVTGCAHNGKGEGLYCRIDTLIKMLEGRIGNQVFVHGGIFAVRRALLPYVPDHLSHDAIVPLRLTLDGYRTLYEPEAISVEAYDLGTAQDWRRRVRTVLQSIQSYLYIKEALNPFRTGFYAVQILSHRFSRWFVLPVLILALLSNLLSAVDIPFYRATLALQLVCYGLALVGFLLDAIRRRPAIFYFPFYFVYIHIPAFMAVILHVAGRKMTVWRPAKRELSKQQPAM